MKNKKRTAFGSKTDRTIFPIAVKVSSSKTQHFSIYAYTLQPNRFGNENRPVNLCQDPELGPGKYEYEDATKLVNNLGPSITNKNGIVLNRSSGILNFLMEFALAFKNPNK